MNEYLVIDSGRYSCTTSLRTSVNTVCMALRFPEKLRWCSIEQVCQGELIYVYSQGPPESADPNETLGGTILSRAGQCLASVDELLITDHYLSVLFPSFNASLHKSITMSSRRYFGFHVSISYSQRKRFTFV